MGVRKSTFKRKTKKQKQPKTFLIKVLLIKLRVAGYHDFEHLLILMFTESQGQLVVYPFMSLQEL